MRATSLREILFYTQVSFGTLARVAEAGILASNFLQTARGRNDKSDVAGRYAELPHRVSPFVGVMNRVDAVVCGRERFSLFAVQPLRG